MTTGNPKEMTPEVVLKALPGLLSGDKERFKATLLSAAEDLDPGVAAMVGASLLAADLPTLDGVTELDKFVASPIEYLLTKIDLKEQARSVIDGLAAVVDGDVRALAGGMDAGELLLGAVDGAEADKEELMLRICGIYAKHGLLLAESDADIISRTIIPSLRSLANAMKGIVIPALDATISSAADRSPRILN